MTDKIFPTLEAYQLPAVNGGPALLTRVPGWPLWALFIFRGGQTGPIVPRHRRIIAADAEAALAIARRHVARLQGAGSVHRQRKAEVRRRKAEVGKK